ncbi:hypothetical protein CLV71_115175 [Actinophytocola oryzae]|uniref:Uncharacterized protein n=1 Tax=Actinophytocola oryzae TaxID=502181 RepID=A0A4R7V4U6_9PSEU|nr:hypothetical protein CLV71_115175 [Actinophytocola oryzae]
MQDTRPIRLVVQQSATGERGAGVDSMALLHLWCHNPHSRDFDLDELLVITAIIFSSNHCVCGVVLVS